MTEKKRLYEKTGPDHRRDAIDSYNRHVRLTNAKRDLRKKLLHIERDGLMRQKEDLLKQKKAKLLARLESAK